jgi:hypothetical protein
MLPMSKNILSCIFYCILRICYCLMFSNVVQ